MDLQCTFCAARVVNKAQLSEPVHEEADPRSRGADHLRQGFLADLWDHGFRNAFLAEMSEQQKYPGQSLFAGIKQLVDQILFVTDVAREQLGHKHFRK